MADPLTHLSKDDLVTLFRGVGGQTDITLEVINHDIDIGAPVNDDGTINLYDYAAWLYDAGYLRQKGYYEAKRKDANEDQAISDD